MALIPLVTVYIPCRNYGRFLRQSVESVYEQLFTNWELIIIDEGSNDDSVRIAEELCRQFPDKARLIKNTQAIGLQRLANIVLGLAKGKYMVRLDADDWLDENALLVLVTKLESSPDIGIAYGNYFYTDPNGNVLGIERRHRLGIEDNVGHLPPHGACTMVRIRSLKAVGGYSEDINAQDGWELWYKLYDRIGATSLNIPVFYYRQHGDSLSQNSNRLLKARSRIFERIGRSLDGDYKLKNVAVIPVKESYPDFEGVPYRDYGGASLLELAIKNAANSPKITVVIVSSASQRVLDFAAGLESSGLVPSHLRLLRSEEGNERNIPIRELMLCAGEYFYSNTGEYPDTVAFLSLHAINRRSTHIDNALNVLRVTESDSVTSVQEERDPMFRYGVRGLELLNPGRFNDLFYDRERLYRFNGAILLCWWEILQQHHLFGDKIGHVEMTVEDSTQIKHAGMLPLAHDWRTDNAC